MSQYEVSTMKPHRVRANSFIEADSETAAIAEFRKKFRLDKYEADRKVKLDIKIACIKEDSVAPPVAKDSAAKVVAELRADKAVAAKEAVQVATESRPAVPFEELRPHGVGDGPIAALVAAGLSTVDEVVAYARKNGGLNGVKDIGPEDGAKIAAAIKAVKTGTGK